MGRWVVDEAGAQVVDESGNWVYIGTYREGTQLLWTANYNSNYYRRSVGLKTATTMEEFETAAGTWTDFGTYFSPAINPLLSSTEYWEMEEIDMGSEVVGSVSLDIDTTDDAGDGELSLYWRYGTSSPLSGAYMLFASGDYTFRYAQFRVYLKSNSPYVGNVYLDDLIIKVDVFDIYDNGASVTIAIGGTQINFNEDFKATPAIEVTSQDSPLIPKITSEDKDGFICTLYDKDGNDVGGVADWTASGY